MYISRITAQNFRNYKDLTLSFANEGALFYGENGAGKTNILEAIYFLCVGRSQRGAAKRDMIHKDAGESYLEGHFSRSDDLSPTSLSIGFSRSNKLSMHKNGRKVNQLSELFLGNNIVSFSSRDAFLIYGDPLERRKYMDILLSQTDPVYFENLVNYKKNLLNRNKILTLPQIDSSINIYEEKMAEHGTYILKSRKMLFDTISPIFSKYYNKISSNTNTGEVKYTASIEPEGEDSWRDRFLGRLKENRDRDRTLGCTTTGPHRDDFKCFLNENVVKSYGSQGQCRSMALSLRLCALDIIDEKKEGSIIILVDDAFSELDNTRTEHMSILLKGRGQLFLTSLSVKNILFNNIPVFSIENNSVTPICQ